jgi:hypothetical protein
MKAICEGCSGHDHPEDACVLSVEKLKNENVVLPLSCPWGRSERSCKWRLVPEDQTVPATESDIEYDSDKESVTETVEEPDQKSETKTDERPKRTSMVRIQRYVLIGTYAVPPLGLSKD